jgi:hypothetical protein
MSRISGRQWRDTFRAGGYTNAEQRRFITKLKSRINEGLALSGRSPALTRTDVARPCTAEGGSSTFRPPHGPHSPAPSSAAEEPIATIGLEAGHANSGRHLESLEDLSRSWIDTAHIAFVTFPGAVPELVVDPGDAGHEPVGLDRSKNRSGVRIDLMDLPVSILPEPECSFGPREAGTAARRRDRGEYLAGIGIDLLDAIVGELIQVVTVERGSRMRGNIDRPQRLPAGRIERLQRASGRKPDTPAVIRDAMDVVDTREGAVLLDDFSW